MDTRRRGPGERIVFEPYTREAYEESQARIRDHGIFEDGKIGEAGYEKACVTL